MPKKHTPGYQNTKPKAVSHTSLASSRTTADSNARPETVNDRLAQLRVSQRSGTQLTSPPDSALSPTLLDSNAASRLTSSVRRSGRISGPAPPRSWIDVRTLRTGLQYSRHAPKTAKTEAEQDAIYHLPVLPDQPLPLQGSLRAAVLQVLARTFSQQIQHDSGLIYDLNARMKCELVAFMALSPPGNTDKLTQGRLLYLFEPLQDEDGTWFSGGEGVTHLSLGRVIGVELDYPHLAKDLRRNPPIQQEETPESWDDAESAETGAHHFQGIEPEMSSEIVKGTTSRISKPPWLPLLPSLTHLSLARPASPCWSSLLEVGGLDCLSNLTHLDLSYWPAPSLRSRVNENGLAPIQLETTFSNTRDIQREGIRVLNRLGKACRKLIWLGLEGCENWLHYLTIAHQRPSLRARSRFEMEENPHADDMIRMDWTGVWRGLNTVKVVQSWAPLPLVSEEITTRRLRIQSTPNSTFREWWEKEQKIREIEVLVAEWRVEAGLAVVKFEKTPIQSWIDIEIRTLNADQAMKHWRNDSSIRLDDL